MFGACTLLLLFMELILFGQGNDTQSNDSRNRQHSITTKHLYYSLN